MKLENDRALVDSIRTRNAQGAKGAEILRFLAEHGLNNVEMMSHMREAFGLDFDDVSCIGGWFPDGVGELDDSAVSKLLDDAIARQAPGE